MNRSNGFLTRLRTGLLIATVAVGLAACGGGAKTESNPPVTRPGGSDYTGPAPADDDVQAFRINFWEPLRQSSRCGTCHGTGGQAPTFVRTDDVNAAYAQANTIVNIGSPADSRVVAKVLGGHNCWEASNQVCADIITAYITAWAGGNTGGSATEVRLTPPAIREIGASKGMPADRGLFDSTIYPLLTQYCADCHTGTARTPQAPYFASDDVDEAYDAIRGKVDLDTPANSRLVVRLRDEFHNCWSGDCAADATTMQQAIEAFADAIPPVQVDPSLVLSKALILGTDGIPASSGGRYELNMIAKYEFKTGSGNIAYDTSGVEPALNLTLSGDYEWVGGWGVEFHGGKAQGSTSASRKLADRIRATGEYSVEAWVVPANVVQEGPARIISYSASPTARNFMLGQSMYNYDFLNRSSTTDGNGEPALSTADADQRLQATQQHVVITYHPSVGRTIYVNGLPTGDPDPVEGGNLSGWDDTFALVLGNEVSNDVPWEGRLRLVAVYNRALTQAQIAQNFGVGVGQKYFLLFSVGHLISDTQPPPSAYVMFEVSEFDSYSYLFNRPMFITLDDNVDADGIQLSGMRLGINGREVLVGQTYSNVSATLDGSLSRSGQVLSTLGTVIASENGADSDEFFLTFERFGTHSNVVTKPVNLAIPQSTPAPQSDIGLRTFEEINATMSVLTGIPTTRAAVRDTFTTLKQQLPTVENIEGFLSSHQVAVSQLAIEYCDSLVADTGARAAYFPGFTFGTNSFDATQRNALIDPLLTSMLGINLASQPDATEVRADLEALVASLTSGCGGSCSAARTETVAKATCAATLGSAAMLLQ